MHVRKTTIRLMSAATMIATLFAPMPLHAASTEATTTKAAMAASCGSDSDTCTSDAVNAATGAGGIVNWAQANAQIALCEAALVLNAAGCVGAALSGAFSWLS